MSDIEGRHLRPGDRVRWTYRPEKTPAVVLHEVSDGYVLVTTDDGLRAELDGAELEWVAGGEPTDTDELVLTGGSDEVQLSAAEAEDAPKVGYSPR